MSIQELGSLGELIAAIATLATLLYLALQVRQNTEQLKHTARDSRTAAASSYVQLEAALARELGMNGQAAHLWFRGLEAYDALADEERSQFIWQLVAFTNQARQSFYLHREGVLDDGIWQLQVNTLRWIVARPGFLGFWELWGDMAADDFWTFLRGMVEEATREEDSA